MLHTYIHDHGCLFITSLLYHQMSFVVPALVTVTPTLWQSCECVGMLQVALVDLLTKTYDVRARERDTTETVCWNRLRSDTLLYFSALPFLPLYISFCFLIIFFSIYQTLGADASPLHAVAMSLIPLCVELTNPAHVYLLEAGLALW